MIEKLEQAYSEWLNSLMLAFKLSRNESHKEAFAAGWNAALASHDKVNS